MENYKYSDWENVFVGDLVLEKKGLLFRVFKVAYKHDNFVGMDVLYDYEDAKKVGNNVAWRKELLKRDNIFIFPHNTLLALNNLVIDFNGAHDKSKYFEVINLYSNIRKIVQAYRVMPMKEANDRSSSIRTLCNNITSLIEMSLSLASIDDIIYYNMITDQFIGVKSIFDRFNNICNSLSEE